MSEALLRRYKEWCPDFRKEDAKTLVIRLNTLKTDEKELKSLFSKKNIKLQRLNYLKNGYLVISDKKFSLASTPEYLSGLFYIQDATSQLVAETLSPVKNDKVLDMAAAPGGKTTHLSQIMDNSGVVIALDIRNDRIEALKNNISRMGCENVIVYNKDGKYSSDLEVVFDKVSLDAPCSGNYCLEQDWLNKRTISEFIEKSKEQKDLLRSAVSVLKKGGFVVYSTCSLEKEEDEDVIEWAVKNLDVELVDTGITVGEQGLTDVTRLCKRFWPHKLGTQGFFIAKLKKL